MREDYEQITADPGALPPWLPWVCWALVILILLALVFFRVFYPDLDPT